MSSYDVVVSFPKPPYPTSFCSKNELDVSMTEWILISVGIKYLVEFTRSKHLRGI